MEDFSLDLQTDSKPKGKLKFKKSTPDPQSTGTPAGNYTEPVTDAVPEIAEPVVSDTQFTPQSSGTQFTPQGSGTQFTPQSSGTQFTPQGSGTQFTPQGSGTQFTPQSSGTQFTPQSSGTQFTPQSSGTQFTPQGGFRPAPSFGNDEEYSDTAKYKGSNDGGYDYGYSKSTSGQSAYGGTPQGQYGGQYGGPAARPPQGQYGGQYGGPAGRPPQGQYGGQYGGPGQGQYGGRYGNGYDPDRERLRRQLYDEPVQQHSLEDGNEARTALLFGIISIVASVIGSAIGMIGGLYCTLLIVVLPIFGLVKAAAVIKKDKKIAVAWVALGLNIMALTPVVIAVLILILAAAARGYAGY